MKAFEYATRTRHVLPAMVLMSKEAEIKQSKFLQLPFELRRIIYSQSIVMSRSPSPEDVYEKNLCAVWEDFPTPLLYVSKQIRAEIFNVLSKVFFTLRVTSYGAGFDMLGLSCFIAQQRPRSYGDLPDLRIDIWPPHPDRPIEMFNIHCRLRMLRDELRAVSHIPKLQIRFLENDFAKWTQDGGPRFELSDPGETSPLHSDLGKLLDHFACVTNVTKARIRLPPSLARDERNEDLIWHASDTIETMEGKDTLAYRQKLTLMDCGMEDRHEVEFKMRTAQKARAKLDAITSHGRHRMTEAEWYEFTKVWPHLETLTGRSEGGPFMGNSHYAK